MKKTLFVTLLLILATAPALLASGAPQPVAPQMALATPVQPVPALALPQLPAFLTTPVQVPAATAAPATLPGGDSLICPILPECDHYCTFHGCLVCC